MKESTLMSRYEFQRMVALHLINPEQYPIHQPRLKRRFGDDDSDV